ncbi:hypothetical protein V5O48_015504, partial [Marasmius crinis-equi]
MPVPPDDWELVTSRDRDPVQGVIYRTVNHGLLKERFPEAQHTAYVWVFDFSKEQMKKLQAYASRMVPPRSLEVEDLRHAGWTILKPSQNPFLLARNKNGTWADKDDILISWSIKKEDYSADSLELLQTIRDEILGSEEDLTPARPKMVNGIWVGGTEFERTRRQRGIKGGRCYPLGTSYQKELTMESPTFGFKDGDGRLEDDGGLRKRVLKAAAKAALEGVQTVTPDLLDQMNRQAEFTNVSRLGVDDNTLWPAGQLNLAPPNEEARKAKRKRSEDDDGYDADCGEEFPNLDKEEACPSQLQNKRGQKKGRGNGKKKSSRGKKGRAKLSKKGKEKATDMQDAEEQLDDDEVEYESSSSEEEEPGVKTRSQQNELNGRGMKRRKLNNGSIKALGPFGNNHNDPHDHSKPPTALQNLTKPHPDVRFNEFFFLYDAKVTWLFEELSTLYFSGLFHHSGSSNSYKEHRTCDRPYYRVTLVLYPASTQLNGTAAQALIGLPVDTWLNVLTVNQEMRNGASPHNDAVVPSCNSATFTHDGLSIMEDKSYLNNIARDWYSFVLYGVRQANPTANLRVSKDVFLSAFSMMADGERITAGPWPLGPGWDQADVEAANSDVDGNGDGNAIPYSNKARFVQPQEWEKLLHKSSRHIPLCISAETSYPNEGIGGSVGARKKVTTASRKAVLGSTAGATAGPSGTAANHDDEENDNDNDNQDIALPPCPVVLVPTYEAVVRARPAFLDVLTRPRLEESLSLLVESSQQLDSLASPSNVSTFPVGQSIAIEELSAIHRSLSRCGHVADRQRRTVQVDILLTILLMRDQLAQMKCLAREALSGQRTVDG